MPLAAWASFSEWYWGNAASQQQTHSNTQTGNHDGTTRERSGHTKTDHIYETSLSFSALFSAIHSLWLFQGEKTHLVRQCCLKDVLVINSNFICSTLSCFTNWCYLGCRHVLWECDWLHACTSGCGRAAASGWKTVPGSLGNNRRLLGCQHQPWLQSNHCKCEISPYLV